MVHATATAGTAVVDDVERDDGLHPGTAATTAATTTPAKPAQTDDFHPLAVVQSCADRLKDEGRDTLTEHSSNLPTLFYLFSFSPPLPSPIRQPLAFANHPITLYFFGIVFAIIAGFCGFPVFDLLYGRYWTNRITGGASPEQIRHASNFAGLMLFLTAVACLIFTWLFQICFARASSQLTERMRHAYVAAVLSQDVAFFDKHGAGEVATFAGKEINTIRTAMGEKMGLTFMTATMMTASLIIGFCTSARVTGFLFAIVPVVVVGFGALGYASDVVSGPALRFEGRASTFLEEVLGSMRIVQSFDMASALLEKYNNDLLRKVERFAKHKAIIRALEAGLVYFAVFVTYSAAFWWVGYQLVRGNVSIGDGLTSFWNLLNSLFAFSMAVPQLAAIIEAITVIKTLRHTIERKPLIDVRNTSGLRLPSSDVQPSFRLDNVTLAYPSRPTIPSLKEVSLTLEAGKVTALVGPSGSGKSTITSLLLREYDPETANLPLPSDEIERITEQKEEQKRLKKEKKKQAQSDEKSDVETPKDDFDEMMETGQMSASVEKEDKEFQASKDKPPVKGAGQVFYSDTDVRSLNIRWLRSQVAIVRQNPQLFSASVFENVAAGLSGTEWAYRPDIDEKTDERTKVIRDKVQRALEKAQAWSFVEKLPEGMDTLVSGGKTGILSGGQRQRLSLARALVRQPQVLVIDEGTSAIDTNTEEKIRLMLEREHAERGMTTVLIAHRLSTVEKADKIIVMRNGRVVDQGTHTQLMHRKREDQTYRQMVMQQREILQETGEEDERSDEEEEKEEVATQSDMTKVVAAPSTIYPLHTVDEHQSEAQTRPNTKRRRASHLSEASSWQVGGREFAKTSSQIELTAEAPATKVELHKDAVQTAETEEAKSASTNAKTSPSSPEDEKCTLSTKQLLRNFAHILGLVKFEFTFGVIGAFIAGGLFPFMGWVTGKGVQALNEPTAELITSGTERWALVFFCVAIAAFILITLQSYLLEAASERLNRWLKTRSLSSLMKQEIGFFDAQDSTSGALASSVSTYPASFSAATGLILSQVCISMANLLGSVILAFVLNAKTSLVVLAPVVLLLFSGWINIYMLEKYEATLLRPAAQGASFLAENVDAIKEIASLGRESETLRIFTYETQSRTPKQTRYLVLGAGGFAISQAVVFGTGALVFYYGGMLLSRGEADITAIYAIFEAAIIGIFAAGRIFQFTGDFGRSISAFKAMSVWFERQPRIAALPPIEDSHSDGNEDIVFSDVELRYPRRPTYPAIRNLNLRIRANQHQAFCGTSGSGKSTILQMVQRFYDPYRGTIHMGATDVRRMDLQALRDRMSYVSQDACLYEGTIKFNLLLGARKGQTVTDAELEKACEDACIHDFIRGLPQGYDSEIGSKGTQLSGGQRQRICIARALIKRPQILLLDEATSALDAQAEVSVQKALDNASKGRTTLTVAHRLSTIRNADVIHVVEDGAIVESGSHDELIAKRGRYLELVQAQL